jgi:hypothetical protein
MLLLLIFVVRTPGTSLAAAVARARNDPVEIEKISGDADRIFLAQFILMQFKYAPFYEADRTHDDRGMKNFQAVTGSGSSIRII